MGAPILAVLLAAANPIFANVGPADFGAQPSIASHSGLDVHVAPVDIQTQFQARMLELSG
ncbi:MAG: hypothetical protein JO194_06650 [Candidatus Eremiobacteraeota bacterium]|nr:hypothetical protein [Candidatus Eremiobacteraeota bacterium]